ncbi:MAG: hypothetical protein Q9175_005189 [Cornicularia normoerica]
MFFHLIPWALCSDTVLAASLPRRPESITGSLAAGPISSTDSLSPANIRTPSSNTSASGNLLKIACDGTRYGKNLRVSSCRNIFHFMKKNETQFTFAERDSGVPNDIPLPVRTLSSGDNKVNVALVDYKPNVKCDPTPTAGPSWNSCVAIFVNMKASKQPRIFGYSGDPMVEEGLPLVLEGGADECSKGLSRNIRLELSAKKYDPSEKIGNASTVTLADAGVVLQDFDTVSPQAGSTGFDRSIPFELLTGVMQDNSTSVTLPGDSWTNNSVIASA